MKEPVSRLKEAILVQLGEICEAEGIPLRKNGVFKVEVGEPRESGEVGKAPKKIPYLNIGYHDDLHPGLVNLVSKEILKTLEGISASGKNYDVSFNNNNNKYTLEGKTWLGLVQFLNGYFFYDGNKVDETNFGTLDTVYKLDRFEKGKLGGGIA